MQAVDLEGKKHETSWGMLQTGDQELSGDRGCSAHGGGQTGVNEMCMHSLFGAPVGKIVKKIVGAGPIRFCLLVIYVDGER